MAHLQALILCDFAQVRDGLLFVSSGAITRLLRPELPAPMGISVAGLLELGPDEVDLAHEVKITVKRDGEVIAQAVGALSTKSEGREPGECPLLPFAIPLQTAAVKDYGVHDVVSSVNGESDKLLSFYVLPPHQ